MNSNHEDIDARELHEAQLTAYALGQLKAKEREAAEQLAARSDEARQQVEETAALAAHIQQAYRQAPAPAASPSLRAAIEQQLQTTAGEAAEEAAALGKLHAAVAKAQPVAPDQIRHGWLRRHWMSIAVTATCACMLMALLLPATQSARESARRLSAGAYNARGLTAPGEAAEEPATETVGRITGAADCRWANPSTRPWLQAKGDRYPSSPPASLDARGRDPYGDENDAARRQVAIIGGYSPRGPAQGKAPPPGMPGMPGMMPPGGASGGEMPGIGMGPGMGPGMAPGGMMPGGRMPGFAPGPDTEQYDEIIDNEFRPVHDQPLSTFAIDVDTASYSNVRRFLGEGRLPPPDAVRIEELINYFPYDYSPPSDAAPVAVHLETAECPWQPDHRLLRVGLKAREIDREDRGPSNLVFLLDVSGSMGEPDKLPLVKQAMRLLVEQLTEDDRVAIVTYASGTEVRLPSARGDERQRILDVIDSLEAGGCTYGSAGIELAYQQAVEHFVPKGTNRVILCTDGDLNVGVTDDDDLVRLIQQKAKSGVFLTVLGFGTGNLKDSKMEKLADKGHGVYAYIDGLREARRVLVEQVAGSLVTVAKDVKIQIEFNPAEVAAYRLVGYENRVLANRDFHDDRKTAGDMGAGHAVTALYELVPANSRELTAPGESPETPRPLKYQRVPERDLTREAHSGELLTLRLRYKEPEGNRSKLLEFTATDGGQRFGRASADFRFAAAVAAFGMVLRSSPHRGQATLAAVEEYAAGALGSDKNGYRAEFLDLVRKARGLAPGR